MANRVERVFIGLGSNLGNGKEVLTAAWRAIGEVAEIVTVALSHPYVSSPVGMASANWFTNAVGELQTTLPPLQVLDKLLQIEAAFGRTRNERAEGYEDRTLDLDMLSYDDIMVDIPGLVLPTRACRRGCSSCGHWPRSLPSCGARPMGKPPGRWKRNLRRRCPGGVFHCRRSPARTGIEQSIPP